MRNETSSEAWFYEKNSSGSGSWCGLIFSYTRTDLDDCDFPDMPHIFKFKDGWVCYNKGVVVSRVIGKKKAKLIAIMLT